MLLSEVYRRRIKELAGILEEAVDPYEIYDKWYKNIPKNTFDTIVRADPTTINLPPEPGLLYKIGKMGIYSKWLLSLYQRKLLKIEDLYKATEYLTLFNNNKPSLKRQDIQIDINKYPDLPSLFNVVEPLRQSAEPGDVEDENELITNQFFINNGQAEKIYEDDKYLIVNPKVFKASKFYGCTTEWCTRFPSDFKNYSQKGSLYVIIDKSKLNSHQRNRRYQFHFETGQFMDISDARIIPKAELPPNIITLFEKIREGKSKYSDVQVVGDQAYMTFQEWSDFTDNFYDHNDFVKDILSGDAYDRFDRSWDKEISEVDFDDIDRKNFILAP